MVLGWESKNEGFLNGGITTAFMLMGMLSFLYLKNAFGIGFWFALAFAPTTTLSKGTLWSVITYLLLCGIIVFFLFDFTFGGQVNNWTVDALGYRISWDEFRSGITAGLGAGFVWILVNNKGLRGMFKRREYSAKNKERKAGINPDWKKDEELVMDYDYDYLIFQDLARIVYVLSLHFTKNKEDFRKVLNSFKNLLKLSPGELFTDCKSVTKLKLKEDYRTRAKWRENLKKAFECLDDVAGSLVSMNEAQEKKIGKRLKKLSAYEENPKLKPYIDQYNLKMIISVLENTAKEEVSFSKIIKKLVAQLPEKVTGIVGERVLLHEAGIILQIHHFLVLQLREMYYSLWAEQIEQKILSSVSPGEATEINFEELNNKLTNVARNYLALWEYLSSVFSMIKSKIKVKVYKERLEKLGVSKELSEEQDLNKLLDKVRNKKKEIQKSIKEMEEEVKKEVDKYEKLTKEQKDEVIKRVLSQVGDKEFIDGGTLKNIVKEAVEALGVGI